MQRSRRNRIELGEWVLEQLLPDDFTFRFDCGKRDLNEFFTKDVIEHERHLLTKAYAFTPIGATVGQGYEAVALIAYCNDAVRQEVVVERASKSFWKKLIKSVPRAKRYDVFPAVKIARLGVQSRWQGRDGGWVWMQPGAYLQPRYQAQSLRA